MKTYSTKPADIKRNWHVINAQDEVLGHLATDVARLLMGKHKPVYTRFLDMGDHVVVINASKVRLTGNKDEQKVYRQHSGYPGGLKETGARTMRAKHPARMIEWAVSGMLPKNKLGKQMFRKLKVYAGDKHPHEAQMPVQVPATDKLR